MTLTRTLFTIGFTIGTLLFMPGCPVKDIDDGDDDDTADDDTGDDDTGDDDTSGSYCDDIAAAAAEVDGDRLADTLSYMTSFARRDDYDVQDEILLVLGEELEEAGAVIYFHEYTHDSRTQRNLIAMVPAGAVEDPEEPHLVIGAHVDSTSEWGAELAPGADDNASGVAAVLETAKILAACELPTRIDFVFFTNEEIGTVGSSAYAGDAAADDEEIVAMIAADMLAFGPDGEDLDLSTKTEMAWLAESFQDAAEAYTGTQTVLRIDDHCG